MTLQQPSGVPAGVAGFQASSRGAGLAVRDRLWLGAVVGDDQGTGRRPRRADAGMVHLTARDGAALAWIGEQYAVLCRAGRWRGAHHAGRQVDVRPLARQYGQLAGKDPDVARAEVLRIVRQLLPLDARMRLAGELPRQVTRAEFELAADALLRFYVSGRQTDDPLLQATQAAYGEVDATSEAILDRTRGGDGSTSVQRKQHREQHAAANRRYVEVWLRWLDHQAGQSS
jgi:hypothetical protein